MSNPQEEEPFGSEQEVSSESSEYDHEEPNSDDSDYQEHLLTNRNKIKKIEETQVKEIKIDKEDQ